MFSWFSLPRKVDEVNRKVDHIMALGKETTAALNELREAISREADEAARKIADYINSLDSNDEATAAAIREQLEGVAGIIPNDPEDTDIPTTETPADEPAEEE